MSQKRAVWIGVGLWVVGLIVGVIIVTMTGAIDPRDPSTNLLGFISLIVLAFLASLYYFSGKGIRKNAKEGLYLGVVFVVVASILDIISLGIYIARGVITLRAVAPYYLSSQFVASIALTILIPVLVGYYNKR